MKICFWVSHIATIGGVQRVTVLIANSLCEKYDVTILSNDNTESFNNVYNLNPSIKIMKQEDFVDVFGQLPYLNKILKRINKLTGLFNREILFNVLDRIVFPKKVKKKLIYYFNSLDFDVIIGVQGYNSLALSMISYNLTATTIGWQHNSFNAYFKNKGEYFWNQDVLFKNYLKYLDEYIVLNEIDKDKVDNAFGISSIYIYNPKSFVSQEKCSMINKNFLAAGRFCKAKGFDTLIKSMSLFSNEIKEWHLTIVGDGEDRSKIEDEISKYNLNFYVDLPGYSDDIKSYFLNSSVLLLPSRWEGMPMIVLEALEMGCPVVSFDIDAIGPLIENDVEGILVPKNQGAQGFADAMKKITSSDLLRSRLAKGAIDKSEKFNLANIIPQWCFILENRKEKKKNEDYKRKNI